MKSSKNLYPLTASTASNEIFLFVVKRVKTYKGTRCGCDRLSNLLFIAVEMHMNAARSTKWIHEVAWKLCVTLSKKLLPLLFFFFGTLGVPC